MSWAQGVENARAAAQQRPAVDVDAPVTDAWAALATTPGAALAALGTPSAEQPPAPKTGFAVAVEAWRAERTGGQ